MLSPKLIEEIWRLIRFSIVGLIATAVHVGVAILTVMMMGTNATFASVTGFVAAFLVSYFGHFKFTFIAPGGHRDYLAKFAVSSLLSFVVSTSLVWFATAILAIDYRVALVAGPGLVVPIFNYCVNKYWVFLQPAAVNGSI